MTTMTQTPTRTWAAVHVHAHWSLSDVDDFLVGTVAPLLAGPEVADWFFVRYSEHGPHLRIRARVGGDPAAFERQLGDRLAAAVRAADHPVIPRDVPGEHPHGTVRPEPYEPETGRYGGPDAIAAAEDVFGRSTELALALLARRPGPQQRLAAALELTVATAEALGLDGLAAARWLRTSAYAWRWHRRGDMVAPARAQEPALAAAAAQAPSVLRRWETVAGQVRDGRGYAGRWAGHVRAAQATPGLPDDVRRLGIWASQLHMLCNRIGVLPDEERSLAWFLAACLQSPQGPADYFADGVAAADRRYLEASRYQHPLMAGQQPRAADPPPRLLDQAPWAGAPVPLPAADPPVLSLAAALTARATTRGGAPGPVTAAELGTLLWSAAAPHGPAVHHGQGEVWRRRPYPSAGAAYPVRLRLIARDVTGLAPGLYDVDAGTRTVRSLAAAPSVAELAAASPWLVERPEPDRIDVGAVPAVLGLYLDLAALRVRYGLRALRFGLLEAGHLAQNLGLVAAATGLAAATIGGFYDDAGAELLLLDGLDDVLVYLIPVGRGANA